MITTEQLVLIMPRAPQLRVAVLLPHLQAALPEFQIAPGLRMAAFIAQLAHESTEFRHFEELADGSEYEGRADLGNTEPGDGARYKGRGPIQLTGRANYRKAGAALGLDLEGDPRRASDADVAFRVAGWFWKSRGLNVLADQCADDCGAFDRITRRINGGLNGKPQRDAYFAKARQVFGC